METNVYTVTVQPEDIDLTGRATIPALYRQIISAVGLNIRREGYGIDVMARRGLTWALARCGFEFSKRPALYSDLKIGVYKGKEEPLCHGRNIEIRDAGGEVIGCGVTDWCVLDKDTHRPVRSDMASALEAREAGCGLPRRIGLFGGGTEMAGRAGYSECDFNGHLNNCRYVERFFDLLPERITSLLKPVRLDINFKTEIRRGAQVIASIKEMGERRTDFCLKQRDTVACLASLSFL